MIIEQQNTDLNGNLIDSLTTENTSVLASNLCSGFYLFEVIDDRGCVAINSGNGQPTPLEIVAGYNVYCFCSHYIPFVK